MVKPSLINDMTLHTYFLCLGGGKKLQFLEHSPSARYFMHPSFNSNGLGKIGIIPFQKLTLAEREIVSCPGSKGWSKNIANST